MPPRWESPFDQPSRRDAAVLAEVLGALQSHLGDRSPDATGNTEGEETLAPSPDVQELIAAALAELQRLSPVHRPEGGIAPVLGSGVVHELLRQNREPRPLLVEEPEPTIDERL